jgi:hypothetical protein
MPYPPAPVDMSYGRPEGEVWNPEVSASASASACSAAAVLCTRGVLSAQGTPHVSGRVRAGAGAADMLVQAGPPPFQGSVYPIGFSHDNQNEEWHSGH